MMSSRHRRPARKGITLLEIVLALGLSAIAISILSQLVGIGNRSASVARDQSKAQLIAESVMAEFTSGISEPVSTSGDWEMDPTWSYDVTVTLAASQTINVIDIVVTQNSAANPVSFNLTQWLAIPPEPEEEETTDEEAGI